MPLTPGTRLGPYEIQDPLGAGGMGEVYRARDTRLGRTVAIKVCRERFSERFQREARVIASLNHPNICTLYDVGPDYLVMEYIDGKPLHGPLPVTAVLRYGAQICDALEAAHRQGVTHRDLKPANILITPTGVKLVDFGLAKMRTETVGDTTVTVPLGEPATAQGTILGTPHYMAPEQIEGKEVDARSDIFALGCVLYELVGGNKAFGGDTMAGAMAAILKDQPPALAERNPAVPPSLDRVIARCLAKDPDSRWQNARDLKYALEDVREREPAPQPAARRSGWSRIVWVATGLAAGVAITLIWLPPRKSNLSTYRLTPFVTEAGAEDTPAWSPDGKALAYVADTNRDRQIFTRSLDASASTRVTNTAADCSLPFWSPDGSRIYYVSQDKLWSVSPAGGVPQLVVSGATSAAISPDGRTLAFTRGRVGAASLWIASPPNADPHLYKQPPFPEKLASIYQPQFSPDGSKIAVGFARQAGGSQPELWILPYPSGAPRQTRSKLPRASTLRAVLRSQTGYHAFSWMPDGRHIVFSGDFGEGGSRLYLVDSESERLEPLTATTGEESEPAVSPDGKRIAFASGTDDFDLVEIPVDGSRVRTLLATSRSEQAPAWSPSASQQYAYVTNAGAVWEIWLRNRQDGSSRPLVRRDPATASYRLLRARFSPDGGRIAYDLMGPKHVVMISNIAGGSPVILDPESSDHHGASWSPDGNWIAYRRLKAGKWELAKAPLGGGDPVSLGETISGGTANTDWSPDGKWICHPRANGLYLVSADGKTQKMLNTAAVSYGFSRDSATVFVIRRRKTTLEWELAEITVPAWQEKKVTLLDVPASAEVAGFSLHPDGRSFATSVGVTRHDIWLLEGFPQPGK